LQALLIVADVVIAVSRTRQEWSAPRKLLGIVLGALSLFMIMSGSQGMYDDVHADEPGQVFLAFCWEQGLPVAVPVFVYFLALYAA
jgi:hypothetical protein